VRREGQWAGWGSQGQKGFTPPPLNKKKETHVSNIPLWNIENHDGVDFSKALCLIDDVATRLVKIMTVSNIVHTFSLLFFDRDKTKNYFEIYGSRGYTNLSW